MWRSLLFASCIVGLPMVAHASGPTATRVLVNTDDVRAVLPAAPGEAALAWLATTGGLVRVRGGSTAEGRRLALFTHLDGLPPGPLQALLRAPDGSVWVGGDGGLVRVAVAGGRPIVRQRLPVRRVRALARFRGALVVGTWAGDVLALRAGALARAFNLPPHQGRPPPVTSLAAADDGLYVGTAGRGLFRFRDGRLAALSRRRLPDATVWTLCGDGPRVWVGTRRGLALVVDGRIRRTPHTRAALRMPVRDVRAILVESPSRLLLGTFGGGAYRLSARGAEGFTAIAASEVHALARPGAHGPLLVGTSRGLLLVESSRATVLRRPGPPSNNISALARGRAGLWVGTFDRGLARYRVADDSWQRVADDALIDPWINHLALEGRGSRELLWVATPRGASRFDLRSGRWTHLRAGGAQLAPGPVLGIHVGTEGVYFASAGGVALRRADGTWQRWTRAEGLALRSITAVATDPRGQLWVGGLDGLAVHRDGRWRHYRTASHELPDDWVTAIVPPAADAAGAGAGQLWVGTYDGGLAQLDAASRRVLRLWREGDGLPCGWVNPQAMLRTADRLWIGTLGRGLVSAELRGGHPAWRRLGLAAGLPSLDVTAIAPAAQGRGLWVGTRAGVALLSTELLPRRGR